MSGRSSSAMRCPRSPRGPILTIVRAVSESEAQPVAVGPQSARLDPPLTWGIGYFFWGWAADKFRREQSGDPSGCSSCSPSASADARRHHVDDVGPTGDRGIDFVLHLHRRRISDGRAKGRLVLRYPRETGAAMMYGIASGSWSLVNLRAVAGHRAVVELDERPALGGNLLADRAAPCDRHCRGWS